MSETPFNEVVENLHRIGLDPEFVTQLQALSDRLGLDTNYTPRQWFTALAYYIRNNIVASHIGLPVAMYAVSQYSAYEPKEQVFERSDEKGSI